MFPSQRFLVAFLAFLGNVFIYVTRVNLSVAVVCMVRDRISNATSLDLELQGGHDFTNMTTTGRPEARGGACGEIAGAGGSTLDVSKVSFSKSYGVRNLKFL
ncbi:hypothetical protein ElyMa_003328700 [Elysia marginata]|uniref:Secreted protein n=1 Tax=Elysia marginata TaxID=1093978 RepID=A0AAV4JGM8_9GAST|nr:hypothetical protein ElyMa_003328700 [Elysia marginata]